MEETNGSHLKKRTDSKIELSAEKLIEREVNEMIKNWQELWFYMADYDMNAYLKIKGTDVFEFWSLFEVWKKKMKKHG